MASIEARSQVIRYPLAFRLLEVTRVERVTPLMVRVTLGGDDLSGFESRSPDDHLKLIFPSGPNVRPVLPAAGPNGITWPEGSPKPVMRDYTPRRFDPVAKELDIDIFVHGDGMGARWAAQAKPGQFVGTAGPRGSRLYSFDFNWYLLCGDETSIPSIARRLEELPEGSRTFAFIEVANAAEEQPLPSRANATIAWIHWENADRDERSLTERALMWFEFPEGPGYTWATGEANDLRRLRRYLLNERGLDKELTNFSGHWKRGAADYDHHEEIGD